MLVSGPLHGLAASPGLTDPLVTQLYFVYSHPRRAGLDLPVAAAAAPWLRMHACMRMQAGAIARGDAPAPPCLGPSVGRCTRALRALAVGCAAVAPRSRTAAGCEAVWPGPASRLRRGGGLATRD
eukprot:SAG22_NODE_180_length_16069_cov_5.323231_11_plen_125_part_00